MSLTMYQLSVPPMLRGLGIMSQYLEKATAHAFDRGIEPSSLVNARLAPDMLSLAGQVQRLSDNAKGAIGRLANVETPSFPDTETTLDELRARIARTVEFLNTVKPEQLQGSDRREIELKFRSVSGKLDGESYLLQVLLPNFYFHLATAHAILRHQGLALGKKDYLGEFGA